MHCKRKAKEKETDENEIRKFQIIKKHFTNYLLGCNRIIAIRIYLQKERKTQEFRYRGELLTTRTDDFTSRKKYCYVDEEKMRNRNRKDLTIVTPNAATSKITAPGAAVFPWEKEGGIRKNFSNFFS